MAVVGVDVEFVKNENGTALLIAPVRGDQRVAYNGFRVPSDDEITPEVFVVIENPFECLSGEFFVKGTQRGTGIVEIFAELYKQVFLA